MKKRSLEKKKKSKLIIIKKYKKMKITKIIINILLLGAGILFLSVSGDDIHLGFGIAFVGIALNGLFS